MALATGTRLGPYEILSAFGAGGSVPAVDSANLVGTETGFLTFLIEAPLDRRAARRSFSVVLKWPALLQR